VFSVFSVVQEFEFIDEPRIAPGLRHTGVHPGYTLRAARSFPYLHQ
jgi:hypothetical protein